MNANFNALVTEVNSLSHIWGQVDATGAVVEGTGFTSSRLNTGVYQITYDTPFSDVAIPVAMPDAGSMAAASITLRVASVSVSSFVVDARTASINIDSQFYLVVVEQ